MESRAAAAAVPGSEGRTVVFCVPCLILSWNLVVYWPATLPLCSVSVLERDLFPFACAKYRRGGGYFGLAPVSVFLPSQQDSAVEPLTSSATVSSVVVHTVVAGLGGRCSECCGCLACQMVPTHCDSRRSKGARRDTASLLSSGHSSRWSAKACVVSCGRRGFPQAKGFHAGLAVGGIYQHVYPGIDWLVLDARYSRGNNCQALSQHG